MNTFKNLNNNLVKKIKTIKIIMKKKYFQSLEYSGRGKNAKKIHVIPLNNTNVKTCLQFDWTNFCMIIFFLSFHYISIKMILLYCKSILLVYFSLSFFIHWYFLVLNILLLPLVSNEYCYWVWCLQFLLRVIFLKRVKIQACILTRDF